MKVHNPVAGGFYPDPSVCRAGRNFYLVNSSFSYFPGLPVSLSTDLEHWTQIGNAVDRVEQLDFSGAGISRGLFAPCIRFHEGKFYIVCTQVDKLGNFIISADDPSGPWSNPAVIGDTEGHCADGIDPSLFFDDDGAAWYIGTHERTGGCRYPGDYEVYIRQIDVHTGILSGKTYIVWDGALKNCIWPEGPHLYKKDGWYYVLAAEGGTGPDHAVMIARSKTLTGKYEGMPRNPLITHRHLGKNAGIINVGHADLFDDSDGGWYMVLLASRPYGSSGCSEGERVCNMGRETFLVPVSWEDGWPVAAPGSGKIENVFEIDSTPFTKTDGMEPECAVSFPVPACTHFTADSLPSGWLTLRQPLFSLTERSGFLRLYTCGKPLRTTGLVSFAGRRQCTMSYTFSCCMEFTPDHADEEAGIVLLQSEDFQYRFAVCCGNKGTAVVRIIMACGSGCPDEVIAESQFDTGGSSTVLAVYADKQNLSFFAGSDMRSLCAVFSGADARILSTERAGGFVGTILGVYASGSASGRESSNHADVLWAEYDPVEK